MLDANEQQIMDSMGFTAKPIKRRARKSKYPKTHPRYWLAVYERNGRQGRPRYEGIPSSMHEAIRMAKRETQQKSMAKRQSRKRARVAHAEHVRVSETQGPDAVKFAQADSAYASNKKQEMQAVINDIRQERQAAAGGWVYGSALCLLVVAFFGLLALMVVNIRTPGIKELEARVTQLEAADAADRDAHESDATGVP